MSLDQVIQRIPKPILVGGILVLALAFFIANDPLKDECDVQGQIFDKNTRGIVSKVKRKGKTQFAQIVYWRDLCKEGNSAGACEDYFNGLNTITKEMKSLSGKCQAKYVEKNEDFLSHITQAMQIIPMLAWGEKPPEGLSSRLGWLTEVNVRTFCALKNTYLSVAGEEAYLALREKVYSAYPDQWSEKTPIESRTPEDRPRAYKTASNPQGSLTKEQVYERSLFSIRCDLYM